MHFFLSFFLIFFLRVVRTFAQLPPPLSPVFRSPASLRHLADPPKRFIDVRSIVVAAAAAAVTVVIDSWAGAGKQDVSLLRNPPGSIVSLLHVLDLQFCQKRLRCEATAKEGGGG